MGTLDGKAVVVTGAGSGIGAAIAKALAREGAAVVVNDIDAAAAQQVVTEIAAAGGRAFAEIADVSSYKQAQRLIDACVAQFGKIDGLVNNAGVCPLFRLEEYEEGALDKVLAVNFVGPMNCAFHAVRHMKPAGAGSIVNITSSSQMGAIAFGGYAGTKAAVATFTYTWAMELAGSGVRVNAVAPRARSGMAADADRYFGARGNEVGQHGVPPEANAPIVAYLLSDLSSGVNGQMVKSEGDLLALMSHPAILAPYASRPDWTVESVAEVFDADFANRQALLGAAVLEVSAQRRMATTLDKYK